MDRHEYYCPSCHLRSRFVTFRNLTGEQVIKITCDWCEGEFKIYVIKEPKLSSGEANQKWIEFCAVEQKKIEDKAKWRGRRYKDDF